MFSWCKPKLWPFCRLVKAFDWSILFSLSKCPDTAHITPHHRFPHPHSLQWNSPSDYGLQIFNLYHCLSAESKHDIFHTFPIKQGHYHSLWADEKLMIFSYFSQKTGSLPVTFSRRQTDDFFLFFPETGSNSSCKLLWRQFAWNVKTCILEKMRNYFKMSSVETPSS